MIKVIVEFTAKPGQRDNLRRALEDFIAKHGTGTPGYLGSTRYEVIGQPDILVELADWESLETRDRHMNALANSGALAPLMDFMGGPFRATVIRPL
jgi:quinol monooxygenase YgiN